jgi:ribose-phosphate pyrophosphokinase
MRLSCILTNEGGLKFARALSRTMGLQVSLVERKMYPDGEIVVQLPKECLEQTEILLVLGFYPQPSISLLEMQMLFKQLDKSNQVYKLLIPCMPFCRHQQVRDNMKFTAMDLLIEAVKESRLQQVYLLDVHDKAVQALLNKEGYEFSYAELFSAVLEQQIDDNVALIAPDAGAIARLSALGDLLNREICHAKKKRKGPGNVEVLEISGDFDKKDCIVVDDIVDSADTLLKVAEALFARGASSVSAYVTHGIFSGSAVQKIEASSLKKLVVGNSVDNTATLLNSEKIQVFDFSEIVAIKLKN